MIHTMNIGRKIRRQRRLLELSQAAVAAALCRSQMHVSRIERGLARPTDDELKTMSCVLGVSLVNHRRWRL